MVQDLWFADLWPGLEDHINKPYSNTKRLIFIISHRVPSSQKVFNEGMNEQILSSRKDWGNKMHPRSPATESTAVSRVNTVLLLNMRLGMT